jgi:hypothetical protein
MACHVHCDRNVWTCTVYTLNLKWSTPYNCKMGSLHRNVFQCKEKGHFVLQTFSMWHWVRDKAANLSFEKCERVLNLHRIESNFFCNKCMCLTITSALKQWHEFSKLCSWIVDVVNGIIHRLSFSSNIVVYFRQFIDQQQFTSVLIGCLYMSSWWFVFVEATNFMVCTARSKQ